MNRKILITGLLLAAVVFLSSCELCEEMKKEFRVELSKKQRQLSITLIEKEILQEKLAAAEKKVQEAEAKIEELMAKAEADAEACELAKQEAIAKAVAEAEAVIREKRLERIRAKAEERERAKEEARKARLEKRETTRSKAREKRETEEEY